MSGYVFNAALLNSNIGTFFPNCFVEEMGRYGRKGIA
jgi:hypothetical protein